MWNNNLTFNDNSNTYSNMSNSSGLHLNDRCATRFMNNFCYILKADSRVGWPNNFKIFKVIFSLKKKTIQFPLFVQSLFSTKKSSKIVNLLLTDETLCLSF